MKRLFALIGFTYLIALTAAVYFSHLVTLVLLAVSLVLFIVSIIIKETRTKKVIPIALFTVFIALLVYSLFYNFKVKPIEKLDNKVTQISGVICEAPYKAYNRYYYVVETNYIGLDNSLQKVKMRISSPKAINADVYDSIKGNVHMFIPEGEDGFCAKTYYASKGIHILGYFEDYTALEIKNNENKPIYYYAVKIREALLSKMRILLPQSQSSLVNGMLLSDKYSIDDDIKSDFKTIGMSHLLALSGLQVSIISQLIVMLFILLRVPKRFACLFSSIVIFFFMMITGFPPSVVRAGIMSIIYLVGIFISRQPDSMNSLGLAVLILSVPNPFAAGDIGLLLSFFATLGIILLSDKINNWFKDKTKNIQIARTLINSINSIIAVTLSATVFTLPIIMLGFKTVSLISPVSNVLLIFPSTVMLSCAAVTLLLSFAGLFSFMAMPFALITGIIANYMISCSRLLSKVPYASVSAGQPFVLLWIAGTLILIAVSLLYKNKDAIRTASLLSVIVLCCGIISYQLTQRGVTHFAVLDTGNGASIVLVKDGHAACLSCGGESVYSSKLLNYLNLYNIKNLDYMLIPDSSNESSCYIDQIISEYNPSALVMCGKDSIKEKLGVHNYTDKKIIYFDKNIKTKLWDNVKIESINIEKNKSFTYVSVNGIDMLICPSGGDLDDIPDYFKDCDFFITSEIPDNYNKINYEYFVLSMDKDNANKCAYNLIKDNNKVIATASSGNVVIDCIDDTQITIRRDV